MSKIIGYCRVSTRGQLDNYSLEQQIGEISDRYKDVSIYEEGYSAAKDRPIFNKVINLLEPGDTLVVTKLDRFCRTTKEGLNNSSQNIRKH